MSWRREFIGLSKTNTNAMIAKTGGNQAIARVKPNILPSLCTVEVESNPYHPAMLKPIAAAIAVLDL